MQNYIVLIIGLLIVISMYLFYKNRKAASVAANQKVKKKRNVATYEQFLNQQGFIVSKKQLVGNRTLYADDVHKQWTIVKGFALVDKPVIYTYSDLNEFEVFEDGESIAKGRADSNLVGGVLFGGGSSREEIIHNTCTNLHVRIRVNDSDNGEIVIPLISKEVLKDSLYYKTQIQIAEKLLAALTYIKNGAVIEETSDETNV